MATTHLQKKSKKDTPDLKQQTLKKKNLPLKKKTATLKTKKAYLKKKKSKKNKNTLLVKKEKAVFPYFVSNSLE